MKTFNRIIGVALAFSLLTSSSAFALKKRGGKGAFAGGSLSMGLLVGFDATEQTELNSLIKTAKANSAATTGTLDSAMEYGAHFTFRFSSGVVALQLRPSYFTQSEKGSGTGGSYNYSTEGFTLFPLVRFIPLSNDLIDFYIQGGLGYGELSGKIVNGSGSANFKGSSFGTQMGLGADFCFFPDHCFGVEGNYRYLPIQRNIVSSSSGTLDGVSNSTAHQELESNNTDIQTFMGGISGVLTYTYNF